MTNYAVDDGEQEIGVRCVAVPAAGGPSAIAISVSGPTARMTPELIERAVPLLHKAATGLTADLSAEGRSARVTSRDWPNLVLHGEL